MKYYKQIFFITLLSLLLTACGSSEEGGVPADNPISETETAADTETDTATGNETDTAADSETATDENSETTADENSEIVTENQVPQVNAGSDINSWMGETIQLQGSASDNDGTISSYHWLQLSGPQVTLNTAGNATSSFVISNITDGSILTFKLTVTDNSGAQSSDQLTVTLNSRLEAAIRTGNPVLLQGDSSTLVNSLQSDFTELNQFVDNTLQTIYQNQSVKYQPGKSSQWLQYQDFARYIPLLIGNKGKSLAAAAEENGDRYGAFGSNPVNNFYDGSNLDYQPHFKSLLAWLLKRDPVAVNTTAKVVLTMLDNTSENKNKSWIETHYPNWEITLCKDESALAACLLDADLIITGSNDGYDNNTVTNALTQAKNSGSALLYLHVHSWNSSALTNTVLSVMNFSMDSYGGNYWSNDVADWQSSTEMNNAADGANSIETMLGHLKNQDYNFDWSTCTSYVGTTSCNNVIGLSSEFEAGAQKVRSLIGSATKKALALFESEDYRILKQLILLGDIYRQNISYIMDKETTDSTEFFKAYYADHAVYYQRDINPKQIDLGNFSAAVSADHPRINKTVEILPNSNGGWTAIGLYALPGEPVTISRTDNDSSDAYIFFNTQRTGSSRVYNSNHYNRPKFLRSQSVLLRAGETITLTTPYGGTIQLDPKGKELIKLQVNNAATQAFLNDMSKIDQYVQDLQNTELSWTQISTPFVQIHALVEHMRTGISNAPYDGDMQKYLDDIWTFLIKDAYELAGFVGTDLIQEQALTSLCTTLQWDCADSTIHKTPKVQHINVDKHSHCGSACSGNPYDQAGPIRPKGWGESHEIGHNLQRSRLKIYGGRSAEVTNQIFPLHKFTTWTAAYPDLPLNKKMKYQETFEAIQQGVANNDIYNTSYNAIWEDDGYAAQNYERMTFLMQILHKGSEINSLTDNWQIFTMIYMHDRLFAAVSSSDWADEKTKFGFSSYESKPNINGNDFMLISLSFISELDQRPFFDLWGITYSAEASAQVASYGFAETERVFYLPQDGNYSKPILHKIPLDGTTAWPL